MSDLPAGNEPADASEAELENPEIEDAEIEDEGDAGAADPESDAGEGDEGEGEEGPQPARRGDLAPRRGARGRPYGEQIRELQAARAADKADFERQLQALVAQRREPSAAERAAEAEAERQRLEMMSPVEIAAYYHQKTLNEVSQQTTQIARGLWEQNDQREYEGLVAGNPAYRRYEAKVNELKTQAPGVPRKILLATAIGMRAMEQGGAARTRATRTAEASAARNAASPSVGRSDVAGERGRRGDNLEDRLRGQSI